jgi:uncharacterized alpha-E superfamily protein
MDQAMAAARAARTDEERETWLQLVRTWKEAAMAVEQSMGLVAESRDLLDGAKEL